MATAESTGRHKAAQGAVVAGIAAAVARAFGLLDIHDLKRTLPHLQAAVYALVSEQGRASSALALSHYRQERVAAGIPGRPSLTMTPAPPREQVDATVKWATTDLWGPATDPQTGEVTITQRLDDAEQKLTDATETLILDNGRDSMVGFSNQDRRARGYAREARPECCYFCAMLASRGAVYKSAQSAGEVDARSVYGADAKGSVNRYHDHCRCQVVPVFGAYEMSAHARQWAADWQHVTAGKSGDAARLAWRQHFEGRAPH